MTCFSRITGGFSAVSAFFVSVAERIGLPERSKDTHEEAMEPGYEELFVRDDTLLREDRLRLHFEPGRYGVLVRGTDDKLFVAAPGQKVPEGTQIVYNKQGKVVIGPLY